MLSQILADTSRFETIFDLLALDHFSDRFDELALKAPEPEALQQALRAVRSLPGYGEDSAERMKLYAGAFEAFPQAFREHFLSWSYREFQYDSSQDHGVFFWQQLLLRSAGEPVKVPWIERVASKYAERMALARTRNSRALSGMDRERLQAHVARVGVEGMASPIGFAESTIAYVAFARSWHEGLLLVADKESGLMDALRWALKYSATIDLPESLVSNPAEWPALLTTWE